MTHNHIITINHTPCSCGLGDATITCSCGMDEYAPNNEVAKTIIEKHRKEHFILVRERPEPRSGHLPTYD